MTKAIPSLLLGLALALAMPVSGRAYSRQSVISRGRYLAAAADCSACHTKPGAQPFAGGEAVPTPFGTIYAPNITFDDATGIGSWTEQDFYRALHSGIDDEGNHLYPAMPYNYYTRMPASDVAAIYAYLKTVAPVHHDVRGPDLAWPFSWRWLMTFWDWVFFDEGTFQPASGKPAAWNRGAYLVNGPGHCGACHTPSNWFGAPETDRTLQGNETDNWFAPMLTGNARRGIGRWTERDIVAFLKTGGTRETGAYGPMTDVVEDSTSKLTDADLMDIAKYLKSLPAAQTAQPESPGGQMMAAGKQIFDAQCAACHTMDGDGIASTFPSLKGNAVVQSDDPASAIHVVLTGVQAARTRDRPTGHAMPAFDWKLTDPEVAAVVTYIRNGWGNAASPVSASDVSNLRQAIGAKPPMTASR